MDVETKVTCCGCPVPEGTEVRINASQGDRHFASPSHCEKCGLVGYWFHGIGGVLCRQCGEAWLTNVLQKA